MRDVRAKASGLGRKISAVGFGGIGLLSSAAVAGTIAASLTFISIGVLPLKSTVVASVVSLGSFFLSTSSATRPIIITPPPVTGSGNVTPTPGATPNVGNTTPLDKQTRVGINLGSPSDWSGERSFVNLVAGSRWRLAPKNGGWVELPADRLNANRDPIDIREGESVVRLIQPPAPAYQGKSVEIRCKWNGKATISFASWVTKNVSISSNSARFTYVPEGKTQRGVIIISKSSPSDPIRDLDCREIDANPTALYTSEYIANISKYRVARFMDFQNTNANLPITWATRTTAKSGEVRGTDGVSIEHMVALANAAKVDPWFCMPWNADADYVRRFAEYVRDNLSPELKAYVEVSNEVWNWGFPVTTQADKEGKARGLSQGSGVAMAMRYAEKTIEDMSIWTDVFKGQTSRIVRVVATQNGNLMISNPIFAFRDLPDHVDALATAPYFYVSAEPTAATNLDDFFATVLPARIASALDTAETHKAVANKYGKRFITYEAGQHLVTKDLELATKIQRDPRMGQLYTQYLTSWNRRFGDLITLYSDMGPISVYGAWGLQEYVGQPVSESPKYTAVMNFISTVGK